MDLQKSFEENKFYAFTSTEVQNKLTKDKGNEWPDLDILHGASEITIYPQVKWIEFVSKGRELTSCVVAADCGGKLGQITLATLYGKLEKIVPYGKSASEAIQYDGILPFDSKFIGRTASRNEAILKAIPENGLKLKVKVVLGSIPNGRVHDFILVEKA